MVEKFHVEGETAVYQHFRLSGQPFLQSGHGEKNIPLMPSGGFTGISETG